MKRFTAILKANFVVKRREKGWTNMSHWWSFFFVFLSFDFAEFLYVTSLATFKEYLLRRYDCQISSSYATEVGAPFACRIRLFLSAIVVITVKVQTVFIRVRSSHHINRFWFLGGVNGSSRKIIFGMKMAVNLPAARARGDDIDATFGTDPQMTSFDLAVNTNYCPRERCKT